MKKAIIIILVILSGGYFHSINSQELYGAEANSMINGTEVLRIIPRTDIPTFIKFKEAERFSISFLDNYLIKQFSLNSDYSFEKYRSENLGNNEQLLRYQQLFKGNPIDDARFNVLVKSGLVISISGILYDNIIIENQPVIAKDAALNNALAEVPAEVYKWEIEGEEKLIKKYLNDPEATYLPKAQLVLFPARYPEFNGTYKYAYKFNIYADKPIDKKDVYIDAENGDVLETIDLLLHADVTATAETKYSGTQEIVADSYGGSYRLRESGRGNGIETYDMNTGTSYSAAVDFTDSDNYWNNFNSNLDEVATDAHWGAEMTYDYYYYNHNRNSIDNNGFKLLSYVHYDYQYSNAFWDGTRMTYGDGSGSTTPFSALDIVGHEITHGLTTFTANLDYAYESGAINEAFSDIFGTAIEFYSKPLLANWLIGEDIGFVIRNMANPNQYSQPDTYHGNYWYFGSDDNGGVHTNSGVMNFWFYLLTQGGSGTNDLGNSYNVTGIGMSDAGKIAYRTLVLYLSNTSQYDDARFYSIMSAIDLFGPCSPEVEAVTRAWYAVGVGVNYVNYVESSFTSDFQQFCAPPAVVSFQNLSVNGTSFYWDFGDNSTSTVIAPSHIYSNYGTYTVSLIAEGGACGSDTIIDTAYISIDPSNPCVEVLSSASQTNTQTNCFGTLYDSGGQDNYQNNTDYSITIAPAGALNVTLSFVTFDFESGYDYLYVYDGPNTFSTLIGQYDGTSLPNGGSIISTGSALTIRQTTDQGVVASGFELNWSCNYANAAPVADFMANHEETCTGEVMFHDVSLNGATSWHWDFGDGNSSSFQHPMHTYTNDGVYSVQLISSNAFGTDTVLKSNYIVVVSAETPSGQDVENCGPGNLELIASGNGLKTWFADSLGEDLLFMGDTFLTPNLTQSTTYYVEAYANDQAENVGKPDNNGGGGYFANPYVHHLVFDCYEAVRLISVKVYAGSSGNRLISLNDENGNPIQQKNIYIPSGESRIILNFDIQPGVNYQLEGPESPDLFRNNNLVNEYPFDLDGIISIKHSSASSAPTGYYYYFYDWEVFQKACETEIIPVVAQIQSEVIAGFNFVNDSGTVSFTNTSNEASWYEWDFGDGHASSDLNPIHHYTQTGVYEVSLIAGNSCGPDTSIQTVNITITGISSFNTSAEGIKVYPNPSDGIFNIEWSGDILSKNISIEVFNMLGEKVMVRQEISSTENRFQIKLNNYPKGIYHIRTFCNNKSFSRKIFLK